MDLATELQVLRDEASCRSTVQKYATAADGDDIEAFVDLFTVDGSWGRPDGRAYCGHGEIRAAYAARPATGFSRHLVANITVNLASDRAQVSSVAVVLKASDASLPLRIRPAVFMVANEDEMLRCQDGRWRISRRRSQLLMNLE
jgi:hypothetical protein